MKKIISVKPDVDLIALGFKPATNFNKYDMYQYASQEIIDEDSPEPVIQLFKRGKYLSYDFEKMLHHCIVSAMIFIKTKDSIEKYVEFDTMPEWIDLKEHGFNYIKEKSKYALRDKYIKMNRDQAYDFVFQDIKAGLNNEDDYVVAVRPKYGHGADTLPNTNNEFNIKQFGTRLTKLVSTGYAGKSIRQNISSDICVLTSNKLHIVNSKLVLVASDKATASYISAILNSYIMKYFLDLKDLWFRRNRGLDRDILKNIYIPQNVPNKVKNSLVKLAELKSNTEDASCIMSIDGTINVFVSAIYINNYSEIKKALDVMENSQDICETISKNKAFTKLIAFYLDKPNLQEIFKKVRED